MAATDDKLVLVYRTPDVVESRAVVAQLAEAEIEAQIVGDFRDTAYPGLQLGHTADKEIYVAQRDLRAAEKILSEWDRLHHAAAQKREPLRFSTMTMLAAITIAALALGITRGGPLPQVIGVAANLAIYLLIAIVIWTRLRRRRDEPDDDAPVAGSSLGRTDLSP